MYVCLIRLIQLCIYKIGQQKLCYRQEHIVNIAFFLLINDQLGKLVLFSKFSATFTQHYEVLIIQHYAETLDNALKLMCLKC